MYFDIALTAYATDRLFGEFRFIRHPVVLMGDYIGWFERRFYGDSVIRGVWLAASLASLAAAIAYELSLIPSTLLQGLIASTLIASKMLYESVKGVLDDPASIRYLVSRDTENLSESEIRKAAIETYAENLSDGVIAPLLYLLCFGLTGVFVYKAINTLDSMVGYRTERYEKFGKASARLDDIANYLPSRITALLILLLSGSLKTLRRTWRYGALHESPNAGYPISAMALRLGVALGGATRYFGELKPKPYFGEGRREIERSDVERALSMQWRIDLFILAALAMGAFA